MDSKSVSRVQKQNTTQNNDDEENVGPPAYVENNKRNQTASYNILKKGGVGAMIIEGNNFNQFEQVAGMSKISVTTNTRRQKIMAAKKKRDALDANSEEGPADPQTLSMSDE